MATAVDLGKLVDRVQREREVERIAKLIADVQEAFRDRLMVPHNDAARIMGLTPQQLDEAVSEGWIQFLLRGARRYYTAPQVVAFLEETKTAIVETTPADCYVYFIEGAGHVKIGYAADPETRLLAHQASSPVRLALLAKVPGGGPLERRLHAAFAVDRSHGEWFRLSDRLRQAIEHVQSHRRLPDDLPLPEGS
jgi:hypothetical protein